MLKKEIAILLLLASLAVLVCCVKKDVPPQPPEPSQSLPPAQSDRLNLSDGSGTGYRVVCSLGTAEANYQIRMFAGSFKSKTGAELPIASKSQGEREIVVGQMADRKETADFCRELPWTAYSVRVIGKTVYVSFHSEKFLEKGLAALLEQISEDGKGGFGIPSDLNLEKNTFNIKEEIPKPVTGGTTAGVDRSGKNSYTVTYTGVTPSEHSAYRSELCQSFTEYSSNEIAGNSFGIYLGNETEIALSYYPSKQILKLAYGKKEDLPELTPSVGKPICTPTVTQLGRKGADASSPNGAPGMSYVIQLADGRFILIDGGPGNEEDEEDLLLFLKKKQPKGTGKPVIAAWFITHAHPDHIQLPINFITRFHKEVEIEAVAYNFPDFRSISMRNENPVLWANLTERFEKVLTAFYPKAERLILHTGQKFSLSDAEIEILYTQEDYYPQVFPTANHTSLAFRIAVGGKNLLFLGDCEKELCQFMADVYGKELKCDILQLTHHGYNGGCLDLYQYADPEICFWASDEYRFLNDPRCLGTAPGYEFNAWIRDEKIRKRIHYHSSATSTVPLGSSGPRTAGNSERNQI